MTALQYSNVGSIGGPPTGGGPLSYAQIVSIAEQAGLDHAHALVAAAIAMAESGGRPTAYNGVGGDNSYGLWQINMIGGLGPARRAQFGIATNDALYDPVTNAKAMFIVSGGGGNWRPWTTFTSGAYRQFLGGGGGSSPGAGGGVGGGVDVGGAVPIASSTPAENNCLLGGKSVDLNPLPFGVPGAPTADIPCLFYKSWGHAILGALVLTAGGVIMAAGVLIMAGRTSTGRQAVGLIASRGASGVTSAPRESRDQRAGREDYERFLLEQQDDAPATTRVMKNNPARRRDTRRIDPNAAVTQEEPF